MKGNLRRMGALLLLLAMLVGMLPQTVLAAAADYTQPYLNQLVNWGFMRGDIDGNLNPDNNITRAEFVTIINRAFGYETVGATPFNDVEDTDWYAEDVAIAYTAGYITGTSANTFSPLAEITREEAAVILARNLMMQPTVGENTDFTDGRDLSNWSSGLVSTAARYNLLSGYPDGSFRPQNPITRGEVAIMVTKAVGTPVQEPGEHTLGSVYGNVVISKSGVTLRDTVIAGNLYITSGVDLGTSSWKTSPCWARSWSAAAASARGATTASSCAMWTPPSSLWTTSKTSRSPSGWRATASSAPPACAPTALSPTTRPPATA